MHVFAFAFIFAGVCFALFEEQSLILYFLLVVAAYVAISFIYPKARNISTRSKIMLATWTDPSEGVINVRLKVRTEKCEALIEKCPADKRVTLTHFVLKAVGELLHEGQDLNGKFVFGKFVAYETCDASCLVDIDGGKDLALVLIKDIPNKSVEDIAGYLKEKAGRIKKNKGDDEHKKRTGPGKMLPAFLVSAMIDTVSFLTSKLGLSVPSMAIKKDQFGAVCVTSLGMLNFEDATAPFSGFMNCSVFASACSVAEVPVVEDGKLVVGRQMKVNFSVDHRYVDGGKAKKFVAAFSKVFENPELYLKSSGRAEEKKNQ